MIYTHQQPSECFITSLAMLVGKTVDRIRKEFCTIAGVRASHANYVMLVHKQPARWWRAFNMIASRYGLYGTAFTKPDAAPAGTEGAGLQRPALKGKGVLLVEFAGGWANAHAVAFQDGVIYDPAPHLTGPLPLEDWLTALNEHGLAISTFSVYNLEEKG